MYKYVSVNLWEGSCVFTGEMFTARDKVPLDALKKDYWQEISMFAHHNPEIEWDGISGVEGVPDVLEYGEVRGKRVLSIMNKEVKRVTIQPGFEKVIIFPDFYVENLEVMLVYHDKKVLYKFKSNNLFMSRYIPVVVFSTVDDYFYIDKAWTNVEITKEEYSNV